MARGLGDPGTLAMVLCQRIAALAHASTAEQRIADADEATRIADELEDPLLMYHAEAYRGFAALEVGDLGGADLHIERQRRLAVRLRQPILSWYDLVMRAKRELIAGSLPEADRLALQGFAAGQEAGQPDAFRWYAAQLFVIRLHLGPSGFGRCAAGRWRALGSAPPTGPQP